MGFQQLDAGGSIVINVLHIYLMGYKKHLPFNSISPFRIYFE